MLSSQTGRGEGGAEYSEMEGVTTFKLWVMSWVPCAVCINLKSRDGNCKRGKGARGEGWELRQVRAVDCPDKATGKANHRRGIKWRRHWMPAAGGGWANEGKRERCRGGLRAAANCLLCVLLTIRFWPNNFVPNTKVSRKCCHTPPPQPTALPFTPATVNRSANVDCDCDGDCDCDYDCERAAN